LLSVISKELFVADDATQPTAASHLKYTYSEPAGGFSCKEASRICTVALIAFVQGKFLNVQTEIEPKGSLGGSVLIMLSH